MRIAISDTDPASADVLAFAAQRRGHQTVTATMDELFARLPFEPSLVVLGLDSPERAHQDVLRVRRGFPDDSVAIFVTVEKPKEPLPARLLEAGANEIIRSPYNPVELIIKAEKWYSARSAASGQADDTLRMADLELALERYTATKNGQRLNFTKLELRLLYCLCEHSPHLTPTERLLTFGWDTLGDPDAALIKTHISHIRKKLRDAGGVPFEITSRQTLGYTLVPGA